MTPRISLTIFLGMLARWMATIIAGLLLAHGVITAGQEPKFAEDTAGLIVGGATLFWSYRAKIAAEVRAYAAAATGHPKPDMTDPMVKSQVAAMIAPAEPMK